MEISTAPHRPAPTPWGRLLALVVVIAPVSVLVLLPVGLGLQRYVMTGDSMAGDRPDSIARGSLVLERLVPVDDLHVGDVITFRPPPGAGVEGRVTHRIVAVRADGIRTRGDAEPAADPWLLRPTGGVVPRVAWVLPGIGYAYLALADWRVWAVVAALLVGLTAALGAGRRRWSARPARPARSRPDRGAGATDAAEDAAEDATEATAADTAADAAANAASDPGARPPAVARVTPAARERTCAGVKGPE